VRTRLSARCALPAACLPVCYQRDNCGDGTQALPLHPACAPTWLQDILRVCSRPADCTADDECTRECAHVYGLSMAAAPSLWLGVSALGTAAGQ